MSSPEIPFGIVDREVFDELAAHFDPDKVMAAREAVDRSRAEIDGLQEARLHRHDVASIFLTGSGTGATRDQIDILKFSNETGRVTQDLAGTGVPVRIITRNNGRQRSDDAFEAR